MIKIKEILNQDTVMNSLIQKYGELPLAGDKDYFNHLVGNIIGQQLSGKAANTIYKRVLALCGGEINAEKILAVSDEALRQAGVSGNKSKYIKNIACAAADKSLDLENLHNYDDEEIIRQLTAIKGIGRWTAEMFLIFSLAREDVFSFGDGGLSSAINKLYGNGAKLSKQEVKTITEKWKPYRSYASLYLWASLDNK